MLRRQAGRPPVRYGATALDMPPATGAVVSPPARAEHAGRSAAESASSSLDQKFPGAPSAGGLPRPTTTAAVRLQLVPCAVSVTVGPTGSAGSLSGSSGRQ